MMGAAIVLLWRRECNTAAKDDGSCVTGDKATCSMPPIYCLLRSVSPVRVVHCVREACQQIVLAVFLANTARKMHCGPATLGARRDMLTTISVWIGVAGGVIGAVAGLLALRDRWKHRRPRLKLFAPYQYTGEDAASKRKCLNLLCRFSNSSQAVAFVYPETMTVQLEKAGKWYPVQQVYFPRGHSAKTDFSKGERVRCAVDDVPFLSRFDATVVTRDKPLSGYLCVTSGREDVLENPTSVRITIRDCHLKKHTMTVDFAKQKRLDPSNNID